MKLNMKKLDFCKDFMLDGYGLSCIENYLLYIFNVEMLPYQYLFFESSLSANEITKAFIDDGISFANFDKIRRLQSIASDYGLSLIHICKLDIIHIKFLSIFLKNKSK